MAGPLSDPTQIAKLGDPAQRRNYALNLLLGCLQGSIFRVGQDSLLLARIQEPFYWVCCLRRLSGLALPQLYKLKPFI
jgi:hypothetical protein